MMSPKKKGDDIIRLTAVQSPVSETEKRVDTELSVKSIKSSKKLKIAKFGEIEKNDKRSSSNVFTPISNNAA